MRAISRLAVAITFVCTVCALPTTTTNTTTTTLYVSHYDGHIYTLALDTIERSLTLAGSLKACGDMPSWLTYDSAGRTLYCVDESGFNASIGNGTLSSFIVSSNGTLSQTAKVTTLPGGVASVIYNDIDGRNYLAIAH
jgi:6-phosphogluconolactonase (cycloisomerase 2 family)